MSSLKRDAFCQACVLVALVVLFCRSGDAVAQGGSEREVTFANGDVTLAGTLVLPEGDGPFPAVAIVHGSGPDTRTPYHPDAAMLARGGIASLIYDKRGTGGSSGDWRTSSLDDLIGDGLAAVHALQAQPEIAPGRVGWMGSSQGAWLAPFAAARDPAVAFFVQITGSATPLANQEMWDDGNSLMALGFSERAIGTTMKAHHLLMSARPLIQRGILPLGDLWFVHYDPYLDPADAWAQVRVPALVMYGGRDATVPSRTSQEVVQRALGGGAAASRIVVFGEAGHALGGPARNANEAYRELVTSWIQSASRGEPLRDMPVAGGEIAEEPLRWYGMGAARTPWYATVWVQLSLILGLLVAAVASVVLGLIPGARLGLDGLGQVPRLALIVAGGVNLASIAGLLLTINYLLNADAEQAAPVLPMGSVLPALSIAGMIMALVLVLVTVRAWRDRAWSGSVRAVYTLAALAAVGMVALMAYWNLLGGRL